MWGMQEILSGDRVKGSGGIGGRRQDKGFGFGDWGQEVRHGIGGRR